MVVDGVVSRQKDFFDNFYNSADFENEYSITNPIALSQWTNNLFFTFLGDVTGKKILSIGGGVDVLSLYLSQKGAIVTCIDISKTACENTAALAEKMGVLDNVTILNLDCEELPYTNEFDVIISCLAIHHMNVNNILEKINQGLKQNGFLLAYEPCCLLDVMRLIHKQFPLHPLHEVTEDEVEFSVNEIKEIGETFKIINISYFNFLSRPLVIYILKKFKFTFIISLLHKVDFYLIRIFPVFRYLSSHVLIKAEKK